MSKSKKRIANHLVAIAGRLDNELDPKRLDLLPTVVRWVLGQISVDDVPLTRRQAWTVRKNLRPYWEPIVRRIHLQCTIEYLGSLDIGAKVKKKVLVKQVKEDLKSYRVEAA